MNWSLMGLNHPGFLGGLVAEVVAEV